MLRALLALVLAAATLPAFAQGFTDNHLTRGALRTEYEPGVGHTQPLSLVYGGANVQGREGCLWHAAEAVYFGCPGRADVAPHPDGRPAWFGIQLRDACGGDATRAGDSWNGCTRYRSSPYFSLGSPASSYWVISANLEPAFDQCRSGPPNLSEPVHEFDPRAGTGHGLFNVARESAGKRQRLHLMVDATKHDFTCEGQGRNAQYAVPFLAIGAVDGRGNQGPVASFRPNAATPERDLLRFTATLRGYQPFSCPISDCPDAGECLCRGKRTGMHAGLLLTARWGGAPRMIFVQLIGAGVQDSTFDAPVHSLWNWPIADSFYYPGSDLVMVTAAQLAQDCPSLGIAPLSTQPQAYSIDISALYACAAGAFRTPPPNESIPVEQAHFYIETFGTRGHAWMSVEGVSTTLDSTR